MKPIIGIIPTIDDKRYVINRVYPEAIIYAGGIPFILPYTNNANDIETYINSVSGLLLIGGADIEPIFYHEEKHLSVLQTLPERDQFEFRFTKEFIKTRKPVLAICRGIQLLNVCFGGTLIQDIPSQHSINTINHKQTEPRILSTHAVEIIRGTKLSDIIREKLIHVNSLHHQAVKTLAPGFISNAVAPDGIVEGIEHTEYPFMIGVQWHPEENISLEHNMKLFNSFIHSC